MQSVSLIDRMYINKPCVVFEIVFQNVGGILEVFKYSKCLDC